MSIQTELTRIINAKTAIKTAVEGKGVTVPDGTLLDGMAALIESIQAGGGGGVAMGRITPADMQASQLEITHGLGSIPEFIFICAATNINSVYSRSAPYGQSFYYVIFDSGSPRPYCIRQQYADTSLYSRAVELNGTALGDAEKYYAVMNEQTFIWANRNSGYGFGRKPTSFFWVAIKELPT